MRQKVIRRQDVELIERAVQTSSVIEVIRCARRVVFAKAHKAPAAHLAANIAKLSRAVKLFDSAREGE